MAQQERVKLTQIKDGVILDSYNFAKVAEVRMRDYMKKQEAAPSSQVLTTSKLRGIYALIMNIYTRINSPLDYERCKSEIQYLKVRMAYESGREEAVKGFLEKTKLMAAIDDVNSFEQFKLYCRYAESLVAYFKFYGGKE